MMRFYTFRLLVVSFVFIFSISIIAEDSLEQILMKELSSVTLLDPNKDLIENIKRHDYRLLGVMGFALYVPGMNGDVDTYPYGVRVLEGTSDCVESQSHEYLITIAENYAKVYNTALITYLRYDASDNDSNKK